MEDKNRNDIPNLLLIGAGSRGQAYSESLLKLWNIRKNHHDDGQESQLEEEETPVGRIVAIAEPSNYKRNLLAKQWGISSSSQRLFKDWRSIINLIEKLGKEKHGWSPEEMRERGKRRGGTVFLDNETETESDGGKVGRGDGIDAVVICTLDWMHREIAVSFAELGFHIMCEKPMATSLEDCVAMTKAVLDNNCLFAIGHVLRYSPHNKLLRKLLVDDKVLGDIVMVNHTEPVGFWHFTHSYVRGNWRNEKTTSFSLMTKCCHDVDLLMWILTSQIPPSNRDSSTSLESHLFNNNDEKPLITTPTTTTVTLSSLTSFGSLRHFNKSNKPKQIEDHVKNCLDCDLAGDEPERLTNGKINVDKLDEEITGNLKKKKRNGSQQQQQLCPYSAKSIYFASLLRGGGWPVDIVVEDLEDYDSIEEQGKALVKALRGGGDNNEEQGQEDEDGDEGREWGRCVYEVEDNDVVDHQTVTMSFSDGKIAILNMVAFTEQICERKTMVYGTHGELTADSTSITVTSFVPPNPNAPPSSSSANQNDINNVDEKNKKESDDDSFDRFHRTTTTTYRPPQEGGHHGGGDLGLIRNFVKAVGEVKRDINNYHSSNDNNNKESKNNNNKPSSSPSSDSESKSLKSLEFNLIQKAQRTHIGSTPEETLISHMAVFAAEEARKGKKVVGFERWGREVMDGLDKKGSTEEEEKLEGRREKKPERESEKVKEVKVKLVNSLEGGNRVQVGEAVIEVQVET